MSLRPSFESMECEHRAFDPQPRLTGELIEVRPLAPADWEELFGEDWRRQGWAA